MKTLDLTKFGVQEIHTNEQKLKNGGWWQAALAAAGAAIYGYNNWDDFVAGLEEGYNYNR